MKISDLQNVSKAAETLRLAAQQAIANTTGSNDDGEGGGDNDSDGEPEQPQQYVEIHVPEFPAAKDDDEFSL